MLENWQNWCRLCAKQNPRDEDSVCKIESAGDQLEIAKKYFLVALLPINGFESSICEGCSAFLTKVEDFRRHCIKVDQMFNELISNENVAADLQSIRFKFGVDSEDFKFDMSDDHEDALESFLDPLLERLPEDLVFKEEESIEVVPPPRKRGRPRKFTTVATEPKVAKVQPEKAKRESLRCKAKNCEPMQNASQEVLPQEKAVKIPKYPKKKSFNECEICSRRFSLPYLLRDHILSKHRREEAPYVCSKCSKRFASKKHLQLHESIHLPPEERYKFPCRSCDKMFPAKQSLKMHMTSMHTKEKHFICEECGKSFATKGTLVTHLLVHSNERPVKCPHCPSRFKTNANLSKHKLTHEDIQYPCPHCDLKLKSKATLKNHLLIHSDVKKYKCNYCGNEYKRSKSLKSHLFLHTGLRPYKCPFCDRTFANGSNCRKHKRTSHPVELAALEASGEEIKATKTPRLEHLQPLQPKGTVAKLQNEN